MANNYCQFSFILDNVTPEQEDFIIDGVNARNEDNYDGGVTFDSNLPELHIFASEYGDLDIIAEVLRDYLATYRPAECLGFTWAMTCSKMRPNEFSGGGVFITKDEIKFLNAETWVWEQCENFAENS